LQTPLGVKRTVDQSSCNVDLSCLKGFCPSFVTVEGAKPRRRTGTAGTGAKPALPAIPEEPASSSDAGLHNVLITGIGGTGVITIGALIGMAAHLEGKGVSVLDMTGMSQKNGSVTSHVRIAADPALLKAQRIPTGEADLVLGCDMLTAASAEAVAKMRPGRTTAVINTFEQPTGHFAQQADWTLPADQVRALVLESTGGAALFLDATRWAVQLLGDAIATNLFMLGFAFQKGLVPLSSAALLRAIEINGVAVLANQAAFQWGRHAAAAPEEFQRTLSPAKPVVLQRSAGLQELVARHGEFLSRYQDAGYARSYTELVERVRSEELRVHGGDRLARAVAANLFKLMAIKDEYEVARLFTDGAFQRHLHLEFEGVGRLRYHMAPPLLGKRDAQGQPVKQAFGPWLKPLLHVLASAKWLRATRFDPFGRTHERRMERRLLAEYREMIEGLLPRLDRIDLQIAIELARLPEQIRGYGHVKQQSADAAAVRRTALLQRLEGTPRRAGERSPSADPRHEPAVAA
jgi:indolepyruvate ferredoxin oxidoreductase